MKSNGPPVEEAQHHLQILTGDGDDLLGRPHAVVERDARIPDRVPEPLRDLAEVPATVGFKVMSSDAALER